MSILLLVMLASPPELGLDVSGHAGIGLRQPSTNDGIGVGFAYGASVGYDAGRLIADLPVRTELSFSSDTFGGGQGVDAVDVNTWQGELMALFGLDWVALRWSDQGLRLQLLGGPGLRVTRVNIRVLEDNDTTWSAEAFGGLVGGVLWDVGPASVGLRVMWGAPRPRLLQAYLSGAWRF
jgi:hypothetical protein